MIASAPDCPCTPARAGGATVGRGRRAIDGAGSDCSQAALVAAVAKAAAAPITVLVTGSSVDLTPIKANPMVGSILWRGYSGEAAGQATADVIFGTACIALPTARIAPSTALPRVPPLELVAAHPSNSRVHPPSDRDAQPIRQADFDLLSGRLRQRVEARARPLHRRDQPASKRKLLRPLPSAERDHRQSRPHSSLL